MSKNIVWKLNYVLDLMRDDVNHF